MKPSTNYGSVLALRKTVCAKLSRDKLSHKKIFLWKRLSEGSRYEKQRYQNSLDSGRARRRWQFLDLLISAIVCYI